MTVYEKIIMPVFFVTLILLSSSVYAQTISSQTTLNQYISDLQKNPNDNVLREKIIRHVQTLKPAPVIPEEARRHYVMALTLFKGAKKIEDYGESIEEFKSALLIAPWWAEANRDLGMALEAAKRYDEAISALKLYIASGLGEEKARAAQDEIYKIEGMKKLAAREREESSPQAVATREQKKLDNWLKKLDGRRYMYSGPAEKMVIDVKGKYFLMKVSPFIYERGYVESREEATRYEILGRETTVPFYQRLPDGTTRDGGVEYTFIISEDGDRITWRGRWNDGHVREDICLWQR